MSILIRGSNKLVLEEADRSLHDALCVVRSLVKRRFYIAGGGAAETEVRGKGGGPGARGGGGSFCAQPDLSVRMEAEDEPLHAESWTWGSA
jgi:T-complex protein 1 subunit delta